MPERFRGSRLLMKSGVVLLCLIHVGYCAAEPLSVRLKDITTIAGEHPNELIGLGLVVGLNGTGGTSEGTKRAAVEVLQKLGLRADPQTRAIIQQAQEKTDNISVVMVTATLPPHSKPGQKLDVLVAAFDDAESLNGGVLLRTPLKGVDGQVCPLPKRSGRRALCGGQLQGLLIHGVGE